MCPSNGKESQTEVSFYATEPDFKESQRSSPKRKIDQLDDEVDNKDNRRETSPEKTKKSKLESQASLCEGAEVGVTQAPAENIVIEEPHPNSSERTDVGEIQTPAEKVNGESQLNTSESAEAGETQAPAENKAIAEFHPNSSESAEVGETQTPAENKIIEEPQVNSSVSAEVGETQAPAENKVNGNSKPDLATPEAPKFKFGQTLNDPKYSWLNNIGKSPLGSGNSPFLRKKNEATSSFQGFKATSESSSDLLKATPEVDFDDLLTKGKDHPKPEEKPSTTLINLKDDPIATGEEEEISCFEATGKLHVLGDGGKWKDRGVGQLKINCLQSDSSNRRIIMRLESVHKVILNVKVVASIKPTAEGKFVRFSAFESEGSPSSFTFRTSSIETATNMVKEMLKAN